MTPDSRCDEFQFELSVAHDEHRSPSDRVKDHVLGCDTCAAFQQVLADLDGALAAGDFNKSPEIAEQVMAAIVEPKQQWWSIAAVVLVGILIGALVGGVGSRFDVVQAQDLDDRFHAASPSVKSLSADLLVVERGWHPDVPERVYVGTLAYQAPEQLVIDLADTTSYPAGDWTRNDVRLEVSDGDVISFASTRCPVAAIPGCLRPAATNAIRDQKPFEDGVLVPLEIVGPGRSLAWWSGLEVVATPELDGRSTIQIETTVAGVDLIRAITDRGSWRELHPTDRILLWLDDETLIPLRVEVFAADSTERELWQIRRGYDDDPSGEPIFIIQMDALSTGGGGAEVSVPDYAPSGGFVDGVVEVQEPELDAAFTRHRSGTWPLPDGGVVNVAAWSDGRSWLMVEATDDWDEPQLFGMPALLVRQVDLGNGSVGYLDPNGGKLAIHGSDTNVLVSGSVPEEVLLNAGRSLGIRGLPTPDDWDQSSVADIDQLPSGTLIPDIDGWSILGHVEGDQISILMTGAGRRTVHITQTPGSRLDPPIGPDVSIVEVRGISGRSNSAAASLEWVESDRIIQLRSDTVSIEELHDIAEALLVR
jgi:hypothetical protein